MSFEEVERIVGTPLPPSARSHPTWWSNNTGTHVGVRAWRDAGWRTSRVNIAGGKLVFVRDRSTPPSVIGSVDNRVAVDLDKLSLPARKLLDDKAKETSGSESALLLILHEAALARRAGLLAEAAASAPRVRGESADLIREARDER